MYNPFRPGNGIEPPYLAGRTEYLQEFSRALDVFEEGLPRNYLVFGPRGTGKTVLMNHFSLIARQKGWLHVTREFNQRYCDENAFADAVNTDVVNKACEVSFFKKARKAGESLIDVFKPEELSAKGIAYKPFYKEKKKLLEDHLKNLLIENWKVFEKSDAKGLVFIYDEFHSIRDNQIEKNYPLASFLGALSFAQREGCRYAIAFSGLPNLPTNLKEAKTYIERMFVFKEMANLSEEEAQKAIEFPLKDSGYRFEDKLVKQIIKETAGYPYFLQFYCYFLIETMRQEMIRLNDLNNIRKQLLSELDLSFFDDRFKKATPSEQELLLAIAEAESDEMSPTEMMKNLEMDKSTFFTYLANLIEKNLVYKASRGRYTFTIPLFRDFLNRKKAGRKK